MEKQEFWLVKKEDPEEAVKLTADNLEMAALRALHDLGWKIEVRKKK